MSTSNQEVKAPSSESLKILDAKRVELYGVFTASRLRLVAALMETMDEEAKTPVDAILATVHDLLLRDDDAAPFGERGADADGSYLKKELTLMSAIVPAEKPELL